LPAFIGMDCKSTAQPEMLPSIRFAAQGVVHFHRSKK